MVLLDKGLYAPAINTAVTAAGTSKVILAYSDLCCDASARLIFTIMWGKLGGRPRSPGAGRVDARVPLLFVRLLLLLSCCCPAVSLLLLSCCCLALSLLLLSSCCPALSLLLLSCCCPALSLLLLSCAAHSRVIRTLLKRAVSPGILTVAHCQDASTARFFAPLVCTCKFFLARLGFTLSIPAVGLRRDTSNLLVVVYPVVDLVVTGLDT